MSGEQLDVYLRAHTEKVVEKPRTQRKKVKKQPERLPPFALIVDTETRTDVHQRLMFGHFRVCKLVNGQYLTEREGIVYSGTSDPAHLSYSAELAKDELNAIGTFVLNTYADIEVKQFPPQTRLQVHQSFPEFMHKVFWPAVKKGWLIVGFNLPFDLSRLACDWRSMRRKRGFSLVMSKQLETKSQTWIPHPYRPEVRIEAKDARTAFIKRGVPRFRKDEWQHPGRFLDLSTLLFSLFDKHMSLDAWCAEFRKKGYTIDRKLDHEPSGRVTQPELRYCSHDVKITQQLLNAALVEFNRHPLTLLPDKAYSPASIAKAYMHEMGVEIPSQKFTIPAEINGIAMQAYYGGRAECHIRRVPVPVMRLDFVSQYCTVNTLLKNWDVLTAAAVEFPDATDEIRRFLDTITHEKCFEPAIWPQFRFFALAQPDRDIFPVRAAYKTREPDKLNIGLNYITSEQPIWFAGPDIIASILLTGKVPKILKAIRIVPIGKQAGLRAVPLLNIDKFRCDPNVDDFYKLTVELKQATNDESLKKGLKCLGNGGAYGPLVQLDEQPVIQEYFSKKLKQKIGTNPKLNVYSGEHFHQQNAPREIEIGGPFYFPPLASLITSGGRLLLAMAEKYVKDAGGELLFCDTDSLCIATNEKGGHVKVYSRDEIIDPTECAPIPCLSRDKVVEISQRFTSLNPFSFKGTLLKLEDVNYEPSEKKPKGDPAKPFRDLWGFAVSAKRYSLGEGKRFRKLIDCKAHGIGWLLSPLKREKDEDQFAVEFWQKVLQNEGVSLKSTEPHWLDLPAMMKIPVSSPAVLGRLKGFCKPYDFVLAPVVRDGSSVLDEQADKPILVTRFTKNPHEWANAEYFNVRTGRAVRITVSKDTKRSKNVIPVRSYRDVLNSYVLNPETKFNGPSGRPCGFGTRGILQRKHVIVQNHQYCGKEIKRKLEKGLVDHETDAKVKVYENGRVAADLEMIRRLSNFSEREIRDGTGIRRDTIRSFRHGAIVTRKMYHRFSQFLNTQLDRQRLQQLFSENPGSGE